MDNGNSRGQWQSRVGFIAAAAGSAIGLGNIWRFPYIVGRYGGGAFVIVYIIFLLLIGYPIMNSELILGRKTQRNAVGAFRTLAPGTPWQIVGWMGVASGFIILSYYSVIGGWGISYIFKTATYMASDADHVSIFTDFITSPIAPLIWHAVFMAMTIGIVMAGVEEGIERYSKFLMPALGIILLILILRSVTLPGATEGLAFYLKPDFSKFSAEGLLAAMGQVFFSLSLGMGCMITYGSYLSKDEDIPTNAAYIVTFDTLMALLTGLMIFPAAFAFGMQPDQGPGLTFITVPAIFNAMGPSGMFFGTLFFILLVIAALTSAISLLEVVTAYVVDEREWDRKKAALFVGLLIFALGIPSSLGQGIWSHIKLIRGMDFLDTFDFLASDTLLPLGGMLIAIYSGWVWGTEKMREEGNLGARSIKLGRFFDITVKIIAPIFIFIIFLNSIGIIKV